MATVIRRRTEQSHAELELTIERGVFARGRRSYARFLRAMWAFLHPIERRFLGSESYRDVVPDAAQRTRADRARTDLSSLGELTVTDEVPVPDAVLPPMRSLPELLGVAYATEGLTLHLRLLRWDMVERLGLGADGTSFVTERGPATQARWRRFVDRLERAPLDEDDRTAVAEAAARCYERLSAWLGARIPEDP